MTEKEQDSSICKETSSTSGIDSIHSPQKNDIQQTNAKPANPTKYTFEKKNKLKDAVIDFHSYTLKEDKTYGFVAMGMEHGPEIEEVQEELENIKNIKTKTHL